MAEEPNRKIWPPPPKSPPVPKIVLVKSKEMLGLLTDFFLLDFGLGLMLGPIVFLILFNFTFSIAQWSPSPHPAPTSKWVVELAWSAAMFGSTALFGFRVRRYPYLMVGYATTDLILAAVFLFVILCF